MAGPDQDAQATRYAPEPKGGLAPGTLLNGIYRIEERLGAGGMGEVYRATNIANDDQDAIKIIGRGMANQTVVEAMFRKEARVLRRIQSPAVAQLRLFARDPALDVLYFVTEFVAGVSLLDRLRQRAGTPEEVRALMARMAIGLQAVHDAGAIHRDLSPDNIILPDGDVTHAKIIDFGIVKELDPTQVSMIGDGFAGKFGYIAPEQLGFSGSRVGPWTDLYALALVGLAFATGKPVYMGSTMGTADEARRRPIDLSVLPPELRTVFARMLTYDWRERASSASALLAMLDVADGETQVIPQTAAPPPPPPAPAIPAPPPQEPSQPPYQAQPAWPRQGGQGGSVPPYQAQHSYAPPGGYPPPDAYPPQPGYPPPYPPQPAMGGHDYSQMPGTYGAPPPQRRARWPIFAGVAVLLVAIVAGLTWWWMSPLPFAAPGVSVQDTGSGLRYQVLAPGAGGAKPSPGDTVLMRVRRHVSGEGAPDAGSVVVETLTPDRMWVGEIEAIRLMTKGQRSLIWVPASLRGATAAGPDQTPGRQPAVLDIELIDFGPASSPLLQSRIQELGQRAPATTAQPAPSLTMTPDASVTPAPGATDVPATAPTPLPTDVPQASPPRAAAESATRHRPPARAPVQRAPSGDYDDSSPSEASVGKGRNSGGNRREATPQ